MPHCHEALNRIYRRLDIHHDYTLGESFYNPMLSDVVRDLKEKGLAVESQGAVIVPMGEGETPAMVQKRDGAYTYTTTDLATILYRVTTWDPEVILYVVDARQAFHFKSLFNIARRWGYTKLDLEHISFGSILGPDKKPIKTREGRPILLDELLDEAVAKALKVLQDIKEKEGPEALEDTALNEDGERYIARIVGHGAVKYADLCQNRASDYVFTWEKLLAIDGNSATYMQYAYARNRAIFRKGNEDPRAIRANPPPLLLEHPTERAVAAQLMRLEETLVAAAADYHPHLICTYLWDLCKPYSSFNASCKVLKAETPGLRKSRLLLCDLTARTIKLCLGLLGIETLERM
jgi:arginyl-tRNA synthetase